MTTIVFLIEQVAVGLYILTALAIFVTWRHWRQARQAYRATYFELEREIYRTRSANKATLLILLAQFGLVILGVQQVVAPTLRSVDASAVTVADVVDDGIVVSPTPGQVDFNRPPIDANGIELGATEIPQVLATPTMTPTPVGTILPNPPPVAGCDTPGATLQVPANGMLVFEPIVVMGSASTDNFAFYKFELNGPSTFDSFAPLGDYYQPVSSIGELGQFVPSFYQPGEYQFRLTVFDITNTLRAACTVNITISEPIPTPTPLAP